LTGHKQTLKIVDDTQALRSALATAEIWIGGLLTAVLLIRLVLRQFGVEYELHGVYALLPLLLGWSALLLMGAGGLMRRFPQHPILCHVPLLLWMVVFFLAFV
jgi:hypothetical protein